MYFYDPIYMPFSKSHEIPYVMKPNLHHVRAHGQHMDQYRRPGFAQSGGGAEPTDTSRRENIALPLWVIRSRLG